MTLGNRVRRYQRLGPDERQEHRQEKETIEHTEEDNEHVLVEEVELEVGELGECLALRHDVFFTKGPARMARSIRGDCVALAYTHTKTHTLSTIRSEGKPSEALRGMSKLLHLQKGCKDYDDKG